MDYSITGGSDGNEVTQAVANSNYPAIIRTLPVAAYGPNGKPSWTDALVMEQGGAAAVVAVVARRRRVLSRERHRRPRHDQTRSFLERVVIPTNINIEATLTFTGGAGRRWRRARRWQGGRHARPEHRARASQPDKVARADDVAALRRARRGDTGASSTSAPTNIDRSASIIITRFR
jgi:hypothetical protein